MVKKTSGSKYDLHKHFGVSKETEDKFTNAQQNYPTRAIYSGESKLDLVSIDLVDLTKNDEFQHNYCMLAIDCYTRCLFCEWIDSKNTETIEKALIKIFKQMNGTPKRLYTDGEGAIYSNYLQQWFKDRNIEVYSTHGRTHNPIIERVIRTVKSMVEKVLESQKTIKDKRKKLKPKDIFEKVVEMYNDTEHRTIKVKPIDAWNGKDEDTMMELREAHRKHLDVDRNAKNAKEFEINDIVRVSTDKTTVFQKGTKKKWSDVLFTVMSKDHTNPVTYTLKNNKLAYIVSNFYPQEMLLVKRPNIDEADEPTFKNTTDRKKVKFFENDD